MALTDKLTAIGDAIRTKTGETAKLSLGEMPEKIKGIKTGGGFPNGTEWTQLPNNIRSFLKCITYGNGLWVAGGSSSGLWYSVTWEPST